MMMRSTDTSMTVAVGDEVKVTITGRAIHADRHGNVVIEYVKTNGFANRIAVNSHDFPVNPTAAPDAAELARREEAARLVAQSCFDADAGPVGHREHVRRWNDAYPPGTPVRYWTGVIEGRGKVSATRTRAELLGGHTAVVWVEDESSCIALSHVCAEAVTAR